ncbi:MAG: hypothetical protein DMG48_02985 [Acidobacteria bacterium]|nr:MAG: hypothetical protein DMG48_02985 [Acidobacteriota bacterium]
MQRIEINPIVGLSAYRLSHIASHLVFIRPNLRGQHRPDKVKKAVLRALCDRYPNVWPGLNDIAAKASCSTAQARRVLRELEYKDRLVVDISTRQGKKGGRGKNCTVQYFIKDRKIFDIFQQQKWWEAIEETQSSQVGRATNGDEGGQISAETHSSENANPLIPASGMSKPTHGECRTDHSLTDKVRDTDTALQQKDAAPLAAVQAFNSFCQEMEERSAFDLVLWILYRAASIKSGAQIPQSVEYYREAKDNLIGQHDHDWEAITDSAEDKFNKHAYRLVEAKSPDLLAWLKEKAQQFAGRSAVA